MTIEHIHPNSIALASNIAITGGDFEEILLDDDSKKQPTILSRVVVTNLPEDSDSSLSSRSSTNSANSSATEDEYDLSSSSLAFDIDGVKVTDYAFRRESTLSSNINSSVSTHGVESSDESSTAVLSTDCPHNDSLPDNEEFTATSNKLNGYAISSLKHNSSLLLLNPIQASARSRQSNGQNVCPLFMPVHNEANNGFGSRSQLTSYRANASHRRANSSNFSSSTTSLRSINPRQGSLSSLVAFNKSTGSVLPHTLSSPTLSIQASEASRGLRVKSFSRANSLKLNSEFPRVNRQGEGEIDSFSPLPSATRDGDRPIFRRTLSAPRLSFHDAYGAARTPALQQLPHQFIRRSSSTKTVTSQQLLNDNQASNLPPMLYGLTPQQRLRMRRHSAGAKLTVEQLELQCDSDDDGDEIPDEAMGWNVPLSPALFAKTQQKPRAPARPRSAPVGSNKRHHSIRDSRRSLLEGLSSIKESEPTIYFSSAGLEHLSEDAQNLTRAFQSLPSIKAAEQFLLVQAGKPSMKLPPKRRNSDFMDPVPMSKEKKALLSRTRPSWLPPKSFEEERRHLYEYQQMMAQAALAQKERAAKTKKEQARRQTQLQKDEDLWVATVMPCLKKASSDPATQELWWRGVPAKLRRTVWQAQIGNGLGITQEIYDRALKRGRESLSKLRFQTKDSTTSATTSGNDAKQKRMLDMLISDCKKDPLPELNLYGVHGPMHSQLVDILLAFAYYRPEIGYRSGLSYMAGIFLFHMGNAFDSFVALSNMLDNSLCESIFLSDDSSTVTAYYTSFLKVLNAKLPTLYKHFRAIHLPPSAYLEPMLTSFFAEHLSVKATTRVWDLAILKGDSFLLRAALGILAKLEHKLYGSPEEILKVIGWGVPKLAVGHDEDEFMATVRSILKASSSSSASIRAGVSVSASTK